MQDLNNNFRFKECKLICDGLFNPRKSFFSIFLSQVRHGSWPVWERDRDEEVADDESFRGLSQARSETSPPLAKEIA